MKGFPGGTDNDVIGDIHYSRRQGLESPCLKCPIIMTDLRDVVDYVE